MAVNTLCVTTAVIEVGAGLAVLCLPSTSVDLLLGTPLDGSAALAVARVAGVALLALGIACWRARDEAYSAAANGLVAAMLVYNLGVAVVLGAAGLRLQAVSMTLWPAAVVLHAVMAVWCIISLRGWKAQKLELNSTEVDSRMGHSESVIQTK